MWRPPPSLAGLQLLVGPQLLAGLPLLVGPPVLAGPPLQAGPLQSLAGMVGVHGTFRWRDTSEARAPT